MFGVSRCSSSSHESTPRAVTLNRSASAKPALEEEDREEDARDDEELSETAARDRRLDHEHEQQHGHQHADEDLEREPLVQADGGSGSPAPSDVFSPRIRRSAQPSGS